MTLHIQILTSIIHSNMAARRIVQRVASGQHVENLSRISWGALTAAAFRNIRGNSQSRMSPTCTCNTRTSRYSITP
jgi:hypothetical protein